MLPVTWLDVGSPYVYLNRKEKDMKITAIDRIILPTSASKVLAYLWNIENMASYEPKVDKVRVTPESKTAGVYFVSGKFAGLPWKGAFSYSIHATGFSSKMMEGPPGVSVEGGFQVREAAANRCQVTHRESYQFPWWMTPLVPMIQLYLKFALRKELLAIHRATAPS